MGYYEKNGTFQSCPVCQPLLPKQSSKFPTETTNMKQGKTGIDNLAKHWLCGLFTALLTILIQRTASAQTFLYTGIATNVTLGRGTYNITAYGAQGGSGFADNTIGGLGAEVAAKFKFTKARTLTLLVAGAGDSASYTTGAGGGGGSFVVNGTTPLIVAGGGGGGSYNGSASNANVGTSGGIGGGSGDGAGGSGGTGGSGGSGAAGGGGGGLKGVGGGDGGIFTGDGGYSFLLGGSGGTGDTYLDDGDHGGGFGGGGGGGAPGGGGGGGYSGGGGGGIGGGGGVVLSSTHLQSWSSPSYPESQVPTIRPMGRLSSPHPPRVRSPFPSRKRIRCSARIKPVRVVRYSPKANIPPKALFSSETLMSLSHLVQMPLSQSISDPLRLVGLSIRRPWRPISLQLLI